MSPRAPNGSSQAQVLLAMPRVLHQAVRRRAKREALTVTEWIRRAIGSALMSEAEAELAARLADGRKERMG